ncbi:protoheme IX farnesyltransferase, mitochondrial-like isoform X2 [Sycon ciliatum]|uniref:protoheme IX farnesyltransferase, mitochondrial-like isoform X2 n=1 Tax=Sycon ciliatum TaxID=27933 RepID=UPI0031F62E03|eukprot:scpid70285/ scgid4618/ Protoheme IX farnesyltransferase, mitochondrial; Heme O synthase
MWFVANHGRRAISRLLVSTPSCATPRLQRDALRSARFCTSGPTVTPATPPTPSQATQQHGTASSPAVAASGAAAAPAVGAVPAVGRRGWKPMYQPNLKDLPDLYLKLSKSRLTSLVVITAMAGYVAGPASFHWLPFLALSAGTGLCSAAANAVNQTMEIPYDAQMARTRSRVLVRAQLSPLHSACFAATSVTTGTALLTFGCNPLTGMLGFLNFILYTSAYTPLKRMTIWNTWVGSVVGALPPLMGWAACTGSITHPAAWIMPLVLYSWQFPHFHGLSWARRDDYSRGGYVMTAVTDPAMCRRVALRHCAALLGLGMLVPFAGLTSWWFVCGGAAVVNGYFTYLGWQFYRQSNVQSARKLFQFSLLHLIVLMGLLVIGAVAKDATCVGHSWSSKNTESDSSPAEQQDSPAEAA